ncbi:MAG: tRNA dihydrouridine synthase DusB [Candidatus Omnitrophota bacterium]
MFPRVILAPLSGISSLPFRKLNRKFGCKFAYLEMVGARSINYLSRRTKQMIAVDPGDRPLGVQLLGKDPDYLSKALEKFKDFACDLIDFNAACPQKKVTRQGQGAALLKDPVKLAKLLSVMVKESPLPVTVKLRLGWDSSQGIVDLAKRVEDSGVSAVCLHGRTKMQGYSGSVDYSSIRKVKAALTIPVIASGDIWSGVLAKKMFDLTFCDAIAVARGSLGNPWIFREIDEFLDKSKISPRPDIEEVIRVMNEHLNLSIDFYGEKAGVTKFRKFFIWYTRGFLQAKPLRIKVATIVRHSQMLELIDEFLTRASRKI